jgi:hypothetical protein
VAAGLGSVWVSSEIDAKVFSIDPAARDSKEIALPGAEPSLELGASFVYASDFGSGRLTRSTRARAAPSQWRSCPRRAWPSNQS